jgi:hypothetical protein
MTPLKLVTKNPLRVDQLAPTTCKSVFEYRDQATDCSLLQALEVSGEAVEAQFEKWLRPRVTKTDYPGDIPLLIYQICRKFKEEKKDCGSPPRFGSSTWNIPVSRLRVNRTKGFAKDCMKIDR